MTPVRIGFGCTLLERALNGGRLDGIGVYAQNLLAELRGRGEITVLPASFPPKPWEKPLSAAFPDSAAFSCAYGLSAALSAVTALPFPGSAAITRGIDVFHAPDHLVPKIRDVPVVATICDALPVKRPEWVDAGFGQFRSSLLRSAVKWATHVIAISQAMVPELVEHYGIPERSISVVHMGIGRDWLVPAPEEQKRAVMAKYGLTAGYYLFVGTLQPRKNVDNIVTAYEHLPERIRSARQLVIAGQAGWGSEALVSRLHAMRRGGRCSWLQYVPAQELKALYQCAGAFVFPSLSEGFGIPVLEAYASGVPVVTSNLSSLPEVAGKAAVLVDPFSVPELCDAMMQLAENPALGASLVERGRARARELSWELCASRTLDVYRKVL